MVFNRCAGCDTNTCPAFQFFTKIQSGEIDPTKITRGNPNFMNVFVKWAGSQVIKLVCPNVACGISDSSQIHLDE